MGGQPYPSTLVVTRIRPQWEEWPCPGSRGRHASWRQRNTPELAQAHSETCQHMTARRTEQSSVPQQQRRTATPPLQAPAPAQHPTPMVGARPTTRVLHPRTATAACKQGMRKPQRQAPGVRTQPRQWVGGPIQALRRLPALGPGRGSGPTRVAAADTSHGGSVVHSAEAA